MAEENIEANRFEQIIHQSSDFTGSQYSDLCSVINENYRIFPLATLKAFSRLYKEGDDKDLHKYIKDYETRRNIINDKNVIKQYKMDRRIAQKIYKEFSLYKMKIKRIKARYKLKSKFYEFVHPFFRKVFKAENKKESMIENYNRNILHEKQLWKLSSEEIAARDRLVFWDVDCNVGNVNQLKNKLREFSNYVNNGKNLFRAVRSMTDKIDINNICNEAEKTARDGDGAYGKEGNKLCIFDIDNPLQKIDISAKICEPYKDNVKSTILYNGQVIGKIKAEDMIINSFTSPCVYTAQDFYKDIQSKLHAKAPIQQKTLQRDPSEKPVVKEEKDLRSSSKKEGLALPQKADGEYNSLYRYLTKTRGIDPDIVRQCLKSGLIYEDVKHNAVFVGKDGDGNLAFATKRSTLTQSNFKCDVAGSRQDMGFMVNNNANKLYVCEAPIDALSIMSLLKKQGKQVEKASYLATCGTGKNVTIYTRLKENPQIKEVAIANDCGTAERLSKDFPQIQVSLLESKQGKDINDLLRTRTKSPHSKLRDVEVER